LTQRRFVAQAISRAAIAVGQRIEGPVIIEERETTLVVLRGWTASVHPTGAVIAERVA
jgi:N-methylhydantoinase A